MIMYNMDNIWDYLTSEHARSFADSEKQSTEYEEKEKLPEPKKKRKKRKKRRKKRQKPQSPKQNKSEQNTHQATLSNMLEDRRKYVLEWTTKMKKSMQKVFTTMYVEKENYGQ